MSTLAIVGAGNVGLAVGSLAVRAGWDVVLSNSRGPHTLNDEVARLGAQARAATVEDAVRAGELVVLSVPFSAYRRIDPAAFQGAVIVETTNYYPGYSDPEPDLDSRSLTSSELMQRHFAGSQVTKAFNTIYTEHLIRLARDAGADDRSGLPIAGDQEVLVRLSTFIDQIGFDPVEVGSLAESWRIGPGTPAFVTPYQSRSDVHFTRDPGGPADAETIRKAVSAAVR